MESRHLVLISPNDKTVLLDVTVRAQHHYRSFWSRFSHLEDSIYHAHAAGNHDLDPCTCMPYSHVTFQEASDVDVLDIHCRSRS